MGETFKGGNWFHPQPSPKWNPWSSVDEQIVTQCCLSSIYYSQRYRNCAVLMVIIFLTTILTTILSVPYTNNLISRQFSRWFYHMPELPYINLLNWSKGASDVTVWSFLGEGVPTLLYVDIGVSAKHHLTSLSPLVQYTLCLCPTLKFVNEPLKTCSVSSCRPTLLPEWVCVWFCIWLCTIVLSQWD